MLDVAFRYSYDESIWVECTDTVYIEKNIEDIPCITVVEYTGHTYRHNANTEYVFCPKHNIMEEVLTISDNRVVSMTGCCFEGLLGFGEIGCGLDGFSSNSAYFIPYRWRIYQSSPAKPMYIACDVMKIMDDGNGILTRWLNFSLSVDFIREKQLISKFRASNNTSIDWTETDIKIPSVVVEPAIEAMRESTFCATGIKPSVLCQIKNKTTLLGYLERPFDVNIVFLKNFFHDFITRGKDDIFDEIFTREEKDNYKIICKLLEIKPPKSLRKAYAFNPYAIVWYMIFNQWGIKDINYMQKFFYLDDCIASMYLYKFYYCRRSKRVTRDDGSRKWHALEYYCRWVREQKGEKRMLKWLYRVSSEDGLTRLQWDTLVSFYNHSDLLSDEIKERLLKDGPTEYVHDAISIEVTASSENWKSIQLRYNKRVQSYACKINGYEFRLLPSTKMLQKLGVAFNNCVATYRYKIERYDSIIVYVMDDKDYVACIELQNECHIVQALGKNNRRLSGEVNDVCCFWAYHNNLVIDVNDICPISKEELAKYDDVVVEPIHLIKAVDEMDPVELTKFEEKNRCEGYYLRLEYLLKNANKYPISAPYWMEFNDEISRLVYLLPEGKEIFEAADRGNTEAMLALGNMYFDGHVIQRDYNQALKWLKMAADLGNDEAAKKAKQVQHYIKKGISDREHDILDALSNLRYLHAAGVY